MLSGVLLPAVRCVQVWRQDLLQLHDDDVNENMRVAGGGQPLVCQSMVSL